MSPKYLILPLLFALAACGTRPLGGSPNIEVVSTGLPLPAQGTNAYTIGAFDILNVGVFGIEDLEQLEIQVDGSGNVAFPMVGSIQASGRTSAELAAAIADGLRAAHVRDPQVTVNLKELNSHTVTVDGEVEQPGHYPAMQGMTLMSAVAAARGVSDTADLDDVVVFRTVNDQRYAALYNLSAIRRGAYDDPEVYAQDIVIVGNSRSRQLFRDLLQVAPLLTTPLVIALQNNN